MELEVFAASGALTRGQAETALLRRRAGFLACYERALLEQRAAGNYDFAGQTELSVGVTPSGLTERVDLLSSTFTEAALSSCLRRIASGVRYPAARAGGSLSVRLRFAPAT